MGDINLLPKEFRTGETAERDRALHQPGPSVVFTNPPKEKEQVQLTKEIQGGWRYSLKKLWQKLFGPSKISSFGNIVPTTGSSDLLNNKMPVAPVQPRVSLPSAPPLKVEKPSEPMKTVFQPPRPTVSPAIQVRPAEPIRMVQPQPAAVEKKHDSWLGQVFKKEEAPLPKIEKPIPPLPPIAKPEARVPETPVPPPAQHQVPLHPSAPLPQKRELFRLHQVESPLGDEVAPGIELQHQLEQKENWWEAHRSEWWAIIWSLIIVMFLVFGSFVGVYFYGRDLAKKVKATNLQADNVLRQINLAEKDKNEAMAVQQKLKTMSSLLSKHVYWTNAFALVEKNTLNEVYYTSFSGSLDGGFALHALAPDFISAAKQLKVWQEAGDPVTSASSMAFSRQTTTGEDKVIKSLISFDLTLKINPSIFERK